MNNNLISLSERDSHRLAFFLPFYKKADHVMVKNNSHRHLIVPISPTGLLGLKKVWMPYRNPHLLLRGAPLLECFTIDDLSGCVIPKLQHIDSITHEEAEVTFEIYVLTHVLINPPHIFWIEREQYRAIVRDKCIDVFSVSTLCFIIGHLEEKTKISSYA